MTKPGSNAAFWPAWALAVGAAAAVLTGCGGGNSSPAPAPARSSTATAAPSSPPPKVADPAAANGFVSTPLAIGNLPSLPAGPLYVDIEQVPSGPVTNIPVTRDCILYAPSAPQTVVDSSGATSTAVAVFMGPHAASYPKTGIAVAADAFCLRPSSDRGQGPAVPGARSIFSSHDFSDLTAPGPYRAQLALVQIQPSGRGAAHLHPGPETLLAVNGATTYHLGGPTPMDLNGEQSPVTLTVGQAMTHKPNQPIQDYNTGTGTAKALNFIVWPADQPVRTDAHTTP